VPRLAFGAWGVTGLTERTAELNAGVGAKNEPFCAREAFGQVRTASPTAYGASTAEPFKCDKEGSTGQARVLTGKTHVNAALNAFVLEELEPSWAACASRKGVFTGLTVRAAFFAYPLV